MSDGKGGVGSLTFILHPDSRESLAGAPRLEGGGGGPQRRLVGGAARCGAAVAQGGEVAGPRVEVVVGGAQVLLAG